jgi:hypothetical protein
MVIESGDGESQPGEGVSLSSLAEQLDAGEGSESPDELDEEESDEPEVDEPEEDTEDDEGQEERTLTIKVDGKDVTLTESEARELAQKGTDYTNKTMAVAEERKAVQAERERASQYRQHVESANQEAANRLDAWTQYMEVNVGQPPDVGLLDYDTGAYLKAKEQYEARRGQLQQAYAARQTLQQDMHQQRQAWIADKAQATEQALKDTLPGWNDNTLGDLAGYIGGLGLTPQTAEAAMLEPGLWQLAQKAKAYDALIAKKAELKPKTELSKVSKPTASNPTPRAQVRKTDALKAYAARPSLDTLAGLIQ